MSQDNRSANPSADNNQSQPISLSHHRRSCVVCHHAERAAIEEDFLHWHYPAHIARQYGIASRSSIYPHARATGLYSNRNRNPLRAVERFIERMDEAPMTANAVINAIRLHACLTNGGKWIERTHRVVVTRETALSGKPSLSRPSRSRPAGGSERRKQPGSSKSETAVKASIRNGIAASRINRRQKP